MQLPDYNTKKDKAEREKLYRCDEFIASATEIKYLNLYSNLLHPLAILKWFTSLNYLYFQDSHTYFIGNYSRR